MKDKGSADVASQRENAEDADMYPLRCMIGSKTDIKTTRFDRNGWFFDGKRGKYVDFPLVIQ